MKETYGCGEVSIQRLDEWEGKISVTPFCISRSDFESMKKELDAIIDKYRI